MYHKICQNICLCCIMAEINTKLICMCMCVCVCVCLRARLCVHPFACMMLPRNETGKWAVQTAVLPSCDRWWICCMLSWESATNKCWTAQTRCIDWVCTEGDNKRTDLLFVDSSEVPLLLVESSSIFYWTCHTCLLFFYLIVIHNYCFCSMMCNS